MSYLKGILLATLAGAIIGAVALFATYSEPSGCLDICISSAGMFAGIGALAGLGLAFVEGLVIAVFSELGSFTLPRHYAVAGAAFAAICWAMLCAVTGEPFVAVATAITVLGGAAVGAAYAAGANGLAFLRNW
jgi:hypothetical protein